MNYPPYGQQNSGYPPQQPAAPMQYPGQQQQGVTPYQGGYPQPTAGGYPPASGGYPPASGGYPPAGGSYPSYGGGQASGFNQPSYPSQPSYGQQQQQPSYPNPNQYGGGGNQGYPAPSSGYPPAPSAGYPPAPTSGYPAPASGYPAPQQPGQYPSSGSNYPPQQPVGQQNYQQNYPSYPSQQPTNYPSQQPAGYPAQPNVAGGYPSNQPSYGGGYPNVAGGYGGASNVYQSGQPSAIIITPMMSAMTHFQGTCQPAPNFNANQDADTLKKAMRGFGCDDKAVMNILCYRSNAQRQQIRQMFKTMYGKDLINELISELKGNFEDLVVALLYTPEEFDARELQNAMAGAGTIESTLIEIMVTRTNAEINGIKLAFKRLYGRELEQALANETSGHFKRLLVSLSVGGRDESSYTDMGRAAAQAKELYAAGEKQWGTNESVFNATMVATNPAQLQLVFEEYRKLTGHDVEQAVRSEFSSDIEDGLLTVVKCAKNKPAYFAERAYQSMKGMGTKDRMLIRVIVSRCEKDMVQIKQEYQRMYKTPLENAISGDTSGKYKEGLLALVKGR